MTYFLYIKLKQSYEYIYIYKVNNGRTYYLTLRDIVIYVALRRFRYQR